MMNCFGRETEAIMILIKHLQHYVFLEDVLLHRHDVFALLLCQGMHRAALEQSSEFCKLEKGNETLITQLTQTTKTKRTCGMPLNKSAVNALAAAASDEPPLLPPVASDFDGGASRASAAALAAALDSASAALTRAWLRLKGAEKSPATR
jgi:hypothetical protein